MDSLTNYITLSRDLFNHEIWDSKPFSKGQAWIDLIQLANYKDKKTIYKGEVIVCKRGDVNLSFLELGRRWGWDRMTVRRFIEFLEEQKMCATNVSTHRTTITLINYDKYNISCATNTTTDTTTSVQQVCITNKDIKETNNTKVLFAKKVLKDKPTIPLIDKTEYEMEEDFYNNLLKAYPRVDIDTELSKMRSWCLANPRKLKTRKGIHKFINSWLSRAEETKPIETETFSKAFRNKVKSKFEYIYKQWLQNNKVRLTEEDWDLFADMIYSCPDEYSADYVLEEFKQATIQDKQPNFKEFIKQWRLENGK